MNAYRTSVLVAVLATLILLTGCTSVRQEFPDRDPGQVWTAIKAVAQSPEYDDWHLVTNEVWEDPQEARLEIYRELERARYRTSGRPWRERQDWKFQVVLEEDDPPTAVFVSRGIGVPAQADREGRRFFRDVRQLLRSGEIPTPARVEPDPHPEFEPEAVPEHDVDDLIEP